MARRVLVGEREGTDELQRVYWDQVRIVEVEVMGTDDPFFARITKSEARYLLGLGQGQLTARIFPMAPGYDVIIAQHLGGDDGR